MKKYVGCLIITMMLFAVTDIKGDSFRAIGRDYTMTDVIVRPISIGISSWTNDRFGTVPAIYGSICCLSLHNHVRFELGTVLTMQDRLEVAPLTGISTPLGDDLLLGVWYAPFWNLYSPKLSDDPYGVMLGYRF